MDIRVLWSEGCFEFVGIDILEGFYFLEMQMDINICRREMFCL